jgi:hypothetical protein
LGAREWLLGEGDRGRKEAREREGEREENEKEGERRITNRERDEG